MYSALSYPDIMDTVVSSCLHGFFNCNKAECWISYILSSLSMCYYLAVYKRYACILGVVLDDCSKVTDGKCLKLTLTFLTVTLIIRALNIHSSHSLPAFHMSDVCMCTSVLCTVVISCLVPTFMCVSSPLLDAATFVICLTLQLTWKSESACQCKAAHCYRSLLCVEFTALSSTLHCCCTVRE